MKPTRHILIILFSLLFTIQEVAKAQAPSCLWAKGIGGTGSENGKAVTIDSMGNVYTTGYFQGTVDFDPNIGVYNLTSSGYQDIFISKFDVLGNFVWAKSMPGSAGCASYSHSIALDGSGNIYTTGYFPCTVDFDLGIGVLNIMPSGSTNIFISKLDPFGNLIWVKSIGGPSASVESFSLAVDNFDNVYFTGFYTATVDFDPGPGIFNLTPVGGLDVFVSKLDSSGNFLWAKDIGGVLDDSPHSITIDTSGNVYTTGYFKGTADFDPSSGTFNLTSAGGSDIFISKLDFNGDFIWAKAMSGASYDEALSIAIDAYGNVYTTGYFKGIVDFDPGTSVFNLTSTSSGFNDIFISKLDTLGNFLWAKNIGGAIDDQANSIKIDASGNIFITGYYQGISDFDPSGGIFNLSSSGYQDIFISKFDAGGNFLWAKSIGGTNPDLSRSLTLDAWGNIVIIGNSGSSPISFDSVLVYNFGGYDAFIAKLCQINIPTITSSGPTTFCQGDSILLTANLANSYLWSNGATTQSITVSSASIDSVTVTNLGCSATSPAITITLNPLPIVIII